MNATDVLELELQSDPGVLPTVRNKLRTWTTALAWRQDQIEDVVLAVDEALTNVIRHAYGGESGHRIGVHVYSLDDAQWGPGLEVCIRDYGKQVDPGTIRSRDLNDLRPGGLGVHIIQSVMDSVEYSRAAGGGMRLVMRKFRRSAPTAPRNGTEADEQRTSDT